MHPTEEIEFLPFQPGSLDLQKVQLWLVTPALLFGHWQGAGATWSPFGLDHVAQPISAHPLFTKDILAGARAPCFDRSRPEGNRALPRAGAPGDCLERSLRRVLNWNRDVKIAIGTQSHVCTSTGRLGLLRVVALRFLISLLCPLDRGVSDIEERHGPTQSIHEHTRHRTSTGIIGGENHRPGIHSFNPAPLRRTPATCPCRHP